jgi:hypothetical protein
MTESGMTAARSPQARVAVVMILARFFEDFSFVDFMGASFRRFVSTVSKGVLVDHAVPHW